jgi:hypothetical protein
MLGYTGEDQTRSLRAAELLANAGPPKLNPSQFAAHLHLESYLYEVQLEALLLSGAAEVQPRISDLRRRLQAQADRQVRAAVGQVPCTASRFIAAVPAAHVIADLDAGKCASSPLGRASPEPRSKIRADLKFMRDQTPSLSVKEAIRAATGDPSTKHPRFMTEPFGPARPAVSPQLVSLARQHLSAISLGRAADHDFSEFDKARDHRYDAIKQWRDMPASWSPPLKHDVCFQIRWQHVSILSAQILIVLSAAWC